MTEPARILVVDDEPDVEALVQQRFRKAIRDGALSFAFPVPGDGAFQLGLPDLLFFAIFLGAAARWSLRVLATWACLVASFGLTMAFAIYVDPFGIGGLPALPLLCIAFLAPNVDLIWRRLRDERRRPDR